MSIHLPMTKPGGMDAYAYAAPVPGVEDRVVIGPIDMPVSEFCEVVRMALCARPLHATDARYKLIHDVKETTFYGPVLLKTGRGGEEQPHHEFRQLLGR